MTPAQPILCKCEDPRLVLDRERQIVHCEACGHEVVSRNEARFVRLIQEALGQGNNGAEPDDVTEHLAPQPRSTDGGDTLAPAALDRVGAAAFVAMGTTSFDRYVRPYVRAVRRGKLRCYPVAELERWLDKNAELALAGDHEKG